MSTQLTTNTKTIRFIFYGSNNKQQQKYFLSNWFCEIENPIFLYKSNGCSHKQTEKEADQICSNISSSFEKEFISFSIENLDNHNDHDDDDH